MEIEFKIPRGHLEMGKNGIMIFDGEKFISATTVEGNAIMKDLRKQDASQKPLEAH